MRPSGLHRYRDNRLVTPDIDPQLVGATIRYYAAHPAALDWSPPARSLRP